MLLLPDQYAATPLETLLRAAGSGRVGIDHDFLRAVLAHGPAAAEAVAAYAANPPEEDRVDLTPDLFQMLRALRHPAAIPFFVELLHEDDDEAPDEIYQALGELGKDAVEPLLALRAEATEENEVNLEFLLAGLGVKDPRIEALLLARLESDPAEAAIHLSLYGDRNLVPKIEARMASLDPESESAANDRRELEYSLRNLEAPAVADEAEPYDIYEIYPETATPLWDVLDLDEIIAFVGHPAAIVRQEAIEALGEEEPNEEIIEVLLKAAENDPNAGVRGAAWQSLSDAWDDDEISRKMRARMSDGKVDPIERAGAAIAVASNELDEGVEEALKELYENLQTRPSALRGMWRTFNKQFAPYFSKHLGDPVRAVQSEAIVGTGYLGLGYEAKKLEDMFEDPDLRDRALFAYSLCCPAGEFTRAGAKKLYRKVADLAGNLSEEEQDVVKTAIDTRLALLGHPPAFGESHNHD